MVSEYKGQGCIESYPFREKIRKGKESQREEPKQLQYSQILHISRGDSKSPWKTTAEL